jgi:hypothetical protein
MPVVKGRISMQNADVQHLQKILPRSLPSPSGHTQDQGPVALAAQASYLREQLGLAEVTEDSLRALIAMSVLGPQSAGIPPQPLHDELLAILRQFLPDEKIRLERVWDVTIAYGCGTWRELPNQTTSSQGWEQQWQGAMDQLATHVFGWLKAMAAWLHFDVQLKGYAFQTPFPNWHNAQLFASQLWAGTCDCWRLRGGDSDQPLDRRTAQRAARCAREHRLAAWNPAEMTLGNFLARAIKGDKAHGNRTGRKSFVSGALEQGMAFCDLYRDSDIRFGKVLGWHCPQHPDSIFEGAECLDCDEQERLTVFSEATHRRKVVRRLLVRAPTGPYEKEEYWHCQACDTCDTYYRAGLATCPLCNRRRTVGAARTTVWVLGAFASASEAGQQSDTRDQHDELWQAFGCLDAREQELLRLVIVEGLSKKGVARQLELSLAELKHVYVVALQKLKQHLTTE